MAAKDVPKWVPPYISFTSLGAILDKMREAGGAPPQIDRSLFDTFSGGYQSQVLAALKSLKLTDENGVVTQRLTDLVEAENRTAREPLIAAMLREHYPEAIRLGSIKATQGQLEAAFREYGITGDTLRKGIAFYLAAAKYANVPTSPHFKVPPVGPTDGRRTPGRKSSKVRSGQSANGSSSEGSDESDGDSEDDVPGGIEPVIREWLKRIPAKGSKWPKADRDRWNVTFQALLTGIYGED